MIASTTGAGACAGGCMKLAVSGTGKVERREVPAQQDAGPIFEGLSRDAEMKYGCK